MGRESRIAKRKSGPEINPAPPGQTGGRYRPLTAPDIRAIYETALQLLEDLGMGESPDFLTERCLAAGAFRNNLGRLCFPPVDGGAHD